MEGINRGSGTSAGVVRWCARRWEGVPPRGRNGLLGCRSRFGGDISGLCVSCSSSQAVVWLVRLQESVEKLSVGCCWGGLRAGYGGTLQLETSAWKLKSVEKMELAHTLEKDKTTRHDDE